MKLCQEFFQSASCDLRLSFLRVDYAEMQELREESGLASTRQEPFAAAKLEGIEF